MAEINERLGATHGVNLALRVGVNTGEVVAGAVGDGYTVIGDTVNVAARLQSAAQPGSVTVGERTFRATSQAIEYQRARAADAEGQGRAGAGVGGGRRAATRSPRAGRRMGETPLVGRTDKLDLLRSDLRARGARGPPAPRDRDRPGRSGQVAAAPASSSACCASATRRRPSARAAACPYGSGIVYWALGEVIRAEAGIVDGDSAEEAWAKLLGSVEA